MDLNDKGELEAFNPSMSITEISGSVEEQIQHVLDEEVNPMVASHGGVVSLLEVKDHNVYLEFGGGCQGCGMIDVTLKQGVEVMMKAQIPEIEAIYDVTDHARRNKSVLPTFSKIKFALNFILNNEVLLNLDRKALY